MYKSLITLMLLSPLVMSEELELLYDWFDNRPYTNNEDETYKILYADERCAGLIFAIAPYDDPKVNTQVIKMFLDGAQDIRNMLLTPDKSLEDNNMDVANSVSSFADIYDAHVKEHKEIRKTDNRFSDLIKLDINFCEEIVQAIMKRSKED